MSSGFPKAYSSTGGVEVHTDNETCEISRKISRIIEDRVVGI